MAVFFDSNVILYATEADGSFRATTLGLLDKGGLVSVQVLNETANVLRGNKFRYDWSRVAAFLAAVREKCDVVPVSITTHERGILYAQRFRLHIYDAMIVASAVLAGCEVLYSEDMHHGLVIDGLTICNPYRA
jgi:predicted nucleic acid-binding protein